MNAKEVIERLKECYDEIGNERVSVVSDDYYMDIHRIEDVRVNKSNCTIEIVVTN